MSIDYCNKVIREKSQSKFCCKLGKNHEGKCNPFPFLDHIRKTHKKIAEKIIQDAYHTRGNKTKPFKNRSFRWDKPISQEDASRLKDEKNKGVPKKEFSTQKECFRVAQKLTRLIYEMVGAPDCPREIVNYLDKVPDKTNNPCKCPLCLEKLNISDFNENVWGKAKVELWHIEPLKDSEVLHKAENMGWGHRTCNIAQQERTTAQTIDWMEKIVKKHREK